MLCICGATMAFNIEMLHGMYVGSCHCDNCGFYWNAFRPIADTVGTVIGDEAMPLRWTPNTGEPQVKLKRSP